MSTAWFKLDSAPRFLLRDNDAKFLGNFTECIQALGIEQVNDTALAMAERLVRTAHRIHPPRMH